MPTSEAAEPKMKVRCANSYCEHYEDEHADGFGGCNVVFDDPFHPMHCICSKFVDPRHPPQEEHEPAISLIQHERRRQIEVEKWSHESDDLLHKRGDLADAAACYAKVAAMISYPGPVPLELPSCWPWAREWWKPSSDPIRNLVKSAALIVAEIERLQRKATLDAQACPSRSPT